MLEFLFVMGFAFYSATWETPYRTSPNDFIEMVELIGDKDTLTYRASLNGHSVVYTKMWKDSSVVLMDTAQDIDVEKFCFFQKELDSTSGRWRVRGMGFSKKGGTDDSKKFLKNIKHVKWMVPSDAVIKRSKTLHITPVDKIENPFYEVVLDLEKWLRSKWQ